MHLLSLISIHYCDTIVNGDLHLTNFNLRDLLFVKLPANLVGCVRIIGCIQRKTRGDKRHHALKLTDSVMLSIAALAEKAS